jgi:hypothetical protein
VVGEVEDRHHVEAVGVAQAELEHVALTERDAVGVALLLDDPAPDRRARRQVEHCRAELRVAVTHRHRERPVAAGHVHLSARLLDGNEARIGSMLSPRDLEQPADVRLPAFAIVAALFVHRVRAPGAQGVGKQVEYLPVEVALVADEGRDRLGRVAHKQALAHLGVAEALALSLHVAERREGGEQRVRAERIEAEPLRELFRRGRGVV